MKYYTQLEKQANRPGGTGNLIWRDIMNTQEIKQALLDAGAKLWVKDDHERIYINSNTQLEAIGAKITATPKYAGETSGVSSKSKMYFDAKKELFFVESGAMKNTINELGFKAARI